MSLLRFLSVLPLLVAALAVSPTSAAGQDAEEVAKRVIELQDSLKATKTFHFGLSFGWRGFLGKNESLKEDATIDPRDSTVVVDRTDQSDVVLSGVVVAYPFAKNRTQRAGDCGVCRFGFIANLTLASFSDDQLTSFNQSVEGGIGLAYALSNDFGLAVTLERAFRRRLRDHVDVGSKLMADGQIITSLSMEDSRFFVDDNVTAVSVKFVYTF